MSPAVSLHKQELESWVDQRKGNLPKGLLQRIARDGEIGTEGQTGRRKIGPSACDALLTMVNRSGVAGADGQRALIDLLRWHYGFSSGGAPVIALGKLTHVEAEFIRQRAKQLVDEYGRANGLVVVNAKAAQ